MSKTVWVELALYDSGRFVRIFKNKKSAFFSGSPIRKEYREDAVKNIRHQLFQRSGGFCEICGSVVTESSGQMHEKFQHRGKGGEISLENSVFVCATSHKYDHRDRNPRWSKKS